MKFRLVISLALVSIAFAADAATSLDRPIRVTPELEQFVVLSSDGRSYLQIDDMLIPVDAGEKSALYGTTWTAGVVYYQFDASVDAADGRPLSGDGDGRRAAWRAAAKEWEATVAGLTFVEGAGSGNYILVVSAGGNSSYVGMNTGAQTMNIYNWNYRFIIAHEIGHALGLMHEQTRPDRDTYVTVHYDNIETDKSFNYDIWPGTTSYGAYDYASVMHYSRCTFATAGWNCDPDYTMEATAAGAAAVGLTQGEADSAMGQRDDLTVSDIAGVRFLYPGANGLFFASCFENGRTNAWSSVTGETAPCAHGLCYSGAALTPACDPCAATVCAADSYCCNSEWDNQCINEAISWCPYSCP